MIFFQNMLKWLDCNRGCFLAVRLIETGVGRVVVAMRELLAGQLKKVEKIKSTVKGAEILLKKLKETEDVLESGEDDNEEDNSKSEKVTVDEVENAADDDTDEVSSVGDEEDDCDAVEDDDDDDAVSDEGQENSDGNSD